MEYPKFSERCNREVTCDVIFLFQRRVFTFIVEPYGWKLGRECDFVREHQNEGDDDAETMTRLECYDQRLEVCGRSCVEAHWETERVWLSREEATAWGEAKHYNYRDGWRVYAVCAEGELAKLLKNT